MALTTITNAMVSVNAIQGTLIADNAITAVHIASNAVASIQIAENNVTAREIAANTITVAQLADDCVESDKIADGIITTNHLNKAMISSQTEVAVATGDFVLLGDTSDSNNLKKAPISSILAGTLTTAAQTNITSLGTLTALTVDNMAFNGNTLTTTSSDFIIDASHDIILDSDGGDIILKDGGTIYGNFAYSSGDFFIQNPTNDKDVMIRGNDGNNFITALTIDMSDAGHAKFNSSVSLVDNAKLNIGTGADLQLFHDGSDSIINDQGAGALEIRTNELKIKNAAGNENGIYFAEDGGVNLYHNNVSKLSTVAGGITVVGTVTQSSPKTRIYTSQYDGTTTGNTTLDNLGFKPMALWCLMGVNSNSLVSWGFAERQGDKAVLLNNDDISDGTYVLTSDFFGELRFDGSNHVNLTVSSWEDNSVIITRSKDSSGSSATVAYKILVMG